MHGSCSARPSWVDRESIVEQRARFASAEASHACRVEPQSPFNCLCDPLIHWWARQDSNRQPDRYERQEIEQFRRFSYVLFAFDRFCCDPISLFLVRNWCGPRLPPERTTRFRFRMRGGNYLLESRLPPMDPNRTVPPSSETEVYFSSQLTLWLQANHPEPDLH
jgi:hypothetical protein